jgi:pyruvate dehydrogenase phosphatase
MLRRLGRPLLAVGAAATLGGVAYAYYSSRPKDFQLAYRVRDASGRSGTATTTIKYISGQAVDEKINQRNAQHSTVDQKGRTWTWHTAQLNSNDPIEDALAYNIVEKHQGGGNRMFFAVMDGHGGPWTSRLLAKTLIPSVALELELLDQVNSKQSSSRFGLLYETLRSILPKTPFANNAMLDAYSGPNAVASAIQRAFSKLDREIISSPLRFLNKPRDQLTADPLFAPTVLPARSGNSASYFI